MDFIPTTVPLDDTTTANGTSDERPPYEREMCPKNNADGVQCTKERDHEGRHKFKFGRSDARGASTTRGTNATLAGQAVDALCQANAMVAFAITLAGYPITAGALSDREDAFRAQAYAALVVDRKLCEFILRAGGTSSKVSLAIAYGMMFGSVAPFAKMERDNKLAADEAA
jgi:hypothetical protein